LRIDPSVFPAKAQAQAAKRAITSAKRVLFFGSVAQKQRACAWPATFRDEVIFPRKRVPTPRRTPIADDGIFAPARVCGQSIDARRCQPLDRGARTRKSSARYRSGPPRYRASIALGSFGLSIVRPYRKPGPSSDQSGPAAAIAWQSGHRKIPHFACLTRLDLNCSSARTALTVIARVSAGCQDRRI
jgi:hypothetical protein